MYYDKTVKSFYIIISGLFVYNNHDLNKEQLNNNFLPWQHRIFNNNFKPTFSFLKNSYYDNYINNIFPEININDFEKLTDLQLLRHYSYKHCINNPYNYDNITIEINDNKNLLFKTEYFDLFLFPHNIGIFSAKMVLNDNHLSLENISDFSNKIRFLNTNIILSDSSNKISLLHFFENILKPSINLKQGWDIYNPQLKSYIQIDLEEEMNEKDRSYLLYDIGNVSPLGTSTGKTPSSPSLSYLQSQLSNNIISVFNNWSALTLFDTFTRISNNFPDDFKSWEYNYFNIYIHTLYSKFFLYLVSTKLSDVTIVDKETTIIRDEFIEFINDELHSHVSYKFLPNLVIEKLHHSLGIDTEVEKMEIKVQRINEHLQEKRGRTLNLAISIIAFLSVFSSLYDFSEWVVSLGVPHKFMFPYGSLFFGLLIFSVIIFLIFKKNNNN